VRRILGDARYEWLKQRKRAIVRYRPADKQAMAAHYRGEVARIRELRKAGISGPVELIAYD
jgi:hypothetical protein